MTYAIRVSNFKSMLSKASFDKELVTDDMKFISYRDGYTSVLFSANSRINFTPEADFFEWLNNEVIRAQNEIPIKSYSIFSPEYAENYMRGYFVGLRDMIKIFRDGAYTDDETAAFNIVLFSNNNHSNQGQEMKRQPKFFQPASPLPKETKEQRDVKEYMDKVFRDIPWTTEEEPKSKL